MSCEKSFEGCQAARAGGLDAGVLQGECAKVVPVGAAATTGLYLKSEARDQSALRPRTREIGMDRPRFGYLRVLVMLKREGWAVGQKRVYRLYRLEGLQLRMKVKRRKRISLKRGRPVPATGPNQNWSMDFVHDQMLDGRAFRVLTVIDQWSRESVSLEAKSRLTGRCVGKALDEAALERGWPKAITVDNVLNARGVPTNGNSIAHRSGDAA